MRRSISRGCEMRLLALMDDWQARKGEVAITAGEVVWGGRISAACACMALWPTCAPPSTLGRLMALRETLGEGGSQVRTSLLMPCDEAAQPCPLPGNWLGCMLEPLEPCRMARAAKLFRPSMDHGSEGRL